MKTKKKKKKKKKKAEVFERRLTPNPTNQDSQLS